MKVGDPVSVGEVYGKIRAMESATGEKIEVAGPSMPVSVLGLNGVPVAGDEFTVCESEQKARERAEKATEEARAPSSPPLSGNVVSLPPNIPLV